MSDFKRLLDHALTEAQRDLAKVASEETVRAERELAQAKQHAEHMREWRLNLRRFAPIAEWHLAWDAQEWEAVQIVNAWVAGGMGRHCAIFGPKGVGKTIAAAHAVKSRVEPGKYQGRNPVAWLRPDTLVSAVCHAYDPASPRLAPFIVLDEMGEEKAEHREEFMHAMCKLLDAAGHKLLITSNLTKKAWIDAYGADSKFTSRMQHLATAFRVGGESRRSSGGGFF